nr:uncharacterized protein LOC123772027 [Procambarus clarkii]
MNFDDTNSGTAPSPLLTDLRCHPHHRLNLLPKVNFHASSTSQVSMRSSGRHLEVNFQQYDVHFHQLEIVLHCQLEVNLYYQPLTIDWLSEQPSKLNSRLGIPLMTSFDDLR